MRRFQSSRAGFTVWELVIGVTILAILARMLVGATAATSDLTSAGNLEARAHTMSEKAMQQIVADLRMSGEQTVDGLAFPYLFDDGVPQDSAYDAFGYIPAPRSAQPGEADFGAMRSILLALPSDLDGDGRPEIDADADGVPELDGNGDGVVTDEIADTNGIWNANDVTIDDDTRLVWSHGIVSYVVTTGPTGENELVRLVDNGAGGREVLATGVERVQFDDRAHTLMAGNGPWIEAGTIRVRIFFRLRDGDGRVFRSRTEAVVRLRN